MPAKEMSEEADTTWADVMRQAIDYYFEALKDQGIRLEAMANVLWADGKIKAKQRFSTS